MKLIATNRNRNDDGNSLIFAAIVICVGVLATTLPQTQVLARIPLQNLLKNELGVDRTANAAFFFWAGLAWYFKPIAGILSDAFPIFGTRRKGYLIFATVLAVISWLGLYFTPHNYNALLLVCIIINTFMVIASSAIGGYMVEVAHSNSGSGRLTAIRQFIQQVCQIITGPFAGFLASIAFGWTAAGCAGISFLLLPAALIFLKERRKQIDSRELIGNAVDQFRSIVRARTMWTAAGLMSLFYIAPGFSTALFYKQQNDLHMDTISQGNLVFISGVCGVLASIAYGVVCKRLNLRNLLFTCLTMGTVANLGYLFYSSVSNARIIEGVNGVGFTLAELALMDLAIRVTPAGSESLGFALMMSVRNLALFGTDWLGSMLLDRFHFEFNTLVLANSLTTLITVPLVFLLPYALVRKRDAEAYEDMPAPRTAMQE